jgi:hypothetical protein
VSGAASLFRRERKKTVTAELGFLAMAEASAASLKLQTLKQQT